MTEIYERRVVHCSNHKASDLLAAFVAEHDVGDGRVRIALRRSISRFADRRRSSECAVLATLSSQGAGSRYPVYSVSWSGEGTAPAFAGKLTVEEFTSDDRFGLVLSGRYKPFGTPGPASDSMLGTRIATASARDVLRAIATYLTEACAHSEAALAGHRRYL